MLQKGDIVIFLQDIILQNGNVCYSSLELVFKTEIGQYLIFEDNHIITKQEFKKLIDNKIVERVSVSSERGL